MEGLPVTVQKQAVSLKIQIHARKVVRVVQGGVWLPYSVKKTSRRRGHIVEVFRRLNSGGERVEWAYDGEHPHGCGTGVEKQKATVGKVSVFWKWSLIASLVTRGRGRLHRAYGHSANGPNHLP